MSQLKTRILEEIKKSWDDGFIDDPTNLKGKPIASLFETKDDLSPLIWKEA